MLLLDQLTLRPVSGVPFTSFGVAVSCTVPPTGTLAVAGVTSTDATGTGAGGAVTVMADEPLCPSLVAVIVAVPATWPVTSPVALTVATVGVLLDQLIARPGSGVPFASFAVAVSCTVLPASTEAAAGATSTAATGTGGVLAEIVMLHTV